MTNPFEFALVPLDRLRPHERHAEADLERLVERIRSKGEFDTPIWVARGSLVILNGHHRVEALRRLGAVRVPAYLIDYHAPIVRLDRWSPGPPISKKEVEERAREGRLFPPKTTRHRLLVDLPARTTRLSDLFPCEGEPDGHGNEAGPSERRPVGPPGVA
jgi:hypothetical protein